MLILSRQRGRERSEIAEKICYVYACELIKRGHNVIIEALGSRYVRLLRTHLRKKKYRVDEISLIAPLSVCIRRDSTKKQRRLGVRVVKEVYGKHYSTKGYCIDASTKQPDKLLHEIEKVLKF